MRALVKRSPNEGYEYDENAEILDPGNIENYWKIIW